MLRYLLLLAALLGVVNFGTSTTTLKNRPQIMDGGGGLPSPPPKP